IHIGRTDPDVAMSIELSPYRGFDTPSGYYLSGNYVVTVKNSTYRIFKNFY
ncbi:12320_t:CDS:1, partial [Funneliformis geosporum]